MKSILLIAMLALSMAMSAQATDLIFPCENGDVYRQLGPARVFHRQDAIDRHEGITNATELLVTLRGPDLKNLYIRAIQFKHDSGSTFGEAAVINASMHDAIGYVRGFLYDNDANQQITPSKGLHDQTSYYWQWGEWKYAPDRERLDRLLANHDFDKLTAETVAAVESKVTRSDSGYPGDWMRPYEPGGEDHYGDSNTAGSPNASYSDRAYIAWKLFPQHHGPLITLGNWLACQYGTVIYEGDRGRIVRPGRPYQLFDFDTGGFCRPYRQWMGPHNFSFGTIRDAFGRGNLQRVQAADIGLGNRHGWHGKRLMWPSGYAIPYGGHVRMGNRISAEGWNGHDAEHRFRITPLAAYCMLSCSVMARDLLTCLLETSIETIDGIEYPESFRHNSRAASWDLHTFALGWFVTGEQRYLDIARNARDWILGGNATGHEWAKDWLWAGNRVHNNQPSPLYEETWQVAPGVQAADFLESNDLEQSNSWRALRERGERIISAGVVYENGAPIGLSKFIVIDEEDGVSAMGREVAWNGVQHWCVAACWRLEWARIGWRWLSRSHRYYDLSKAAEQCFQWHWPAFMRKD